MGDEDAVTLAVVGARLSDLKTEMQDVKTMLTAQRTEFVGRNEWLMRNAAVDSTFAGQGREIGDLRTELRARRQPWPAVAAVVVSAVALGINLLPALAG